MNDRIPLPSDWPGQARQMGLVAEGDYTVLVKCVECESPNRFRAEYRIQDEGPFMNWVLFETFAMDTYAAKFYDLLLALGIDEQAAELDPGQLTGETLRVTVKHRKDDNDKTWSNVVAHHPYNQGE